MAIKNETTEPASDIKQTIPVSSANNKLILTLLIVIGVLLVVVICGVAFYLGTQKANSPQITNIQQVATPVVTGFSPTVRVSNSPLFSGQLKRLSQNLMIFKTTEDDKLNNVGNDFVYYEAGKFSQGELKDYSRIIAVRPSVGPGQPLVYALATKDYQSYILDDPNGATTKYPENDWQNPYNILDKNKISSIKTFETEQPKEINLDKSFSLYLEEFPTETVPTGKTDKNENKIYETSLITDFSSYQKLTSPFNNLIFYFKPREINAASYISQLSQAEKEKEQLREKYLMGTTEVIVVDSAGLPIVYALTTPDNIKNYGVKLAKYEIDWKTYQDQLKKYQNKEISEYPPSPEYVYPPNLGFKSSEITASQNNLKFYNDYETAIPGACALLFNSNVVNVQGSDLEQVGTVYNLPLYRLKDKNHPLYTLAFKNKMDYYEQDQTAWDQVNKGIKKPTLAEYVDSNSLLFVKDYWGRWVALGEFDIKLPGGCGKPVIYLYPEQPTKVSVKFQARVKFTTDIPKYADFWQVLAHPNGSLLNLKPELTDCRQLDFSKKGSEYAREACQKNIYPYLYWAGNVNSENYPVIDRGWIVDKNDLSVFLNSKLTEVGLNEKEKNDFVSYWLPDIMGKNAPYYRMSFLQTNDLNLLFPMTVSPNPDTIFRIFLDYVPLVDKPQNLPKPQVLNKLVRNGFTLVEWGGLKKP